MPGGISYKANNLAIVIAYITNWQLFHRTLLFRKKWNVVELQNYESSARFALKINLYFVPNASNYLFVDHEWTI